MRFLKIIFTFFANFFRKKVIINSNEFGVLGPEGKVLLAGAHRIPKKLELKKLPLTQVYKNYMGIFVSRNANIPTFEVVYEGYHPVNTDKTEVHLIPITNMVLNWGDHKVAAHTIDKELKSLIYEFDQFKLEFDVSVVMKVTAYGALRVIDKFGSLKAFAESELDKAVRAFFDQNLNAQNYRRLEPARLDSQEALKLKLMPILAEFDISIVDTFLNEFKIDPVDFRKKA